MEHSQPTTGAAAPSRVQCLPIVYMPEGAYFIDLSAKEFRHMQTMHTVPFDSVKGRSWCRLCGISCCRTCLIAVLVPANMHGRALACINCSTLMR